MASCIIALFVWSYFTDIHHISQTIFGGTLVASLAAVTAAVAAVSYLWTPKKYQSITAYAAYILLVATTGVLVINTNGANSPFVALWMVTTVFAGLFGTRTIIALLIAINLHLGYLFFTDQLTNTMIQSMIMAGELPLIISYILWRSKSGSDNSKDRAYYDLANELNQVSNKAEVVINAIGDGVIAVNNQGVIELINPAAQRIVGWGRQDAIGLDYKSILQLLGHDGHELDKSNDPVFNVLTTNQQKRVKDLLLQTNSGKRISVSVVASPTGHMGSGAIVVFRDITKEVAEEKEQAEFISTASHEMRTPVAAIEGYLGLALNPQTATIDDKAREFITKAQGSAQHLGRLFQDLLDVSKADDGRLSNNRKVIDVVTFTNDIIEELQPKAKQKNLRIFFKPQMNTGAERSGMPVVTPVFYTHADADHLREVLSNLVENAVKYTPAGEVSVDITGDNDHVVISISDSGIGIPAEDIPHLFQKFYRVDNSDTREIGGTGLGLYLCRKLIESMNGRIWVESEYKHGSTFFVEIPRISHDEANRLIEASVEDTTPTDSPQTPANPITETVHPPIIMAHKQPDILATPVPAATTPAAAPAPVAAPAPSAPVAAPMAGPQSAPFVTLAQIEATRAQVAPSPAPSPSVAPPVRPQQPPVSRQSAPSIVAPRPMPPGPKT